MGIRVLVSTLCIEKLWSGPVTNFYLFSKKEYKQTNFAQQGAAAQASWWNDVVAQPTSTPTHTHTHVIIVSHFEVMNSLHAEWWNGMAWNLFRTEISLFNLYFQCVRQIHCDHLCFGFFFGFSFLGVKFISLDSSSSDIYAHKITIMTIGQFIEMMNSHLLFGKRECFWVCGLRFFL